MLRRRQTLVSLVLAVAGVALLIWQVRAAGVGELRTLLGQVGWGFFGVLALSVSRMLFRSLAWRTLIGQPVPARSMLAATMTGDAMGNVTPLSLLVSEPAKAVYLGRGITPAHAFAALTAENFFYSVSVAIYIILGTAALLTVFEVPDALLRAGIAALAAMAVVLAVAGWMAWQRPALVSAVLGRLPVPRLTKLIDRVRTFESQAYGSVRKTGRLGIVVSLHLLFHLFSFLEVLLVVFLLTGSTDLVAAFVLDTANRVVNVAFRMVPMRVGVDQVTSEAVALTIGLPPAIGTSLSLVRMLRVSVWALVGFGLLGRRGRLRN